MIPPVCPRAGLFIFQSHLCGMVAGSVERRRAAEAGAGAGAGAGINGPDARMLGHLDTYYVGRDR